ncbi:MAG: type III-B CRISPR module RAMP protein Cmr6 [Methylohalobius sp.]
MLLSIWTTRSDQEEEVRKRAKAKSREGREIADMLQRQGMEATIRMLRERQRNPLPGLWDKNDFAARSAWAGVSELKPRDKERMTALVERQRTHAQGRPNILSLEATAIAPFTTGLGNEHPLENGFAFLWPYGLPYLPGSGVKGVVRRAAQELAQGMWEDDRGWKKLDQPHYRIEYGSGKNRLELSVLDVLFGREPPEGDPNAVRGTLSFWDVIPQIKGDSLMVEIMTPHQSHYYQQKRDRKSGDSTSPHDSGQPNPISFLTVPPGSGFTFYVVCDTQHLARLTREKLDGAPNLLADDRWKKLTEAAFEHAFEWLGFGAKTAVGYGTMRPQKNGSKQVSAESAEPRGDETIWPQASLEFKPNTGEISACFQGQRTAPVKVDLAQAILNQLQPEQRDRLKKKKSLSGISVRVRKQGNMIELLGLAECG